MWCRRCESRRRQSQRGYRDEPQQAVDYLIFGDPLPPLPLPLKAEEDHAKPNDTTTKDTTTTTTETTAHRNDNSSFISQDGVRDLTELLNSPGHDQTTTTEDSQAI